MSDVVIRAEGLGKRYLIGHQAKREGYTALRDVVARTVKGFARSAVDMLHGRQIVVGDEIEEFWALNDVNFEIKRGEVVGIIGHNGAGKSTLLKILSRITEPSAGRVEIRGRVASLLEVGTGFHPELTGRENVFLNGTILGMTRREIGRQFDAIVDFAGVEKFLDTPVKRYSSGMTVRLGFAVAAHLDPEILIVDEVLAVGDIEFQNRCIGKMQSVADSGKTVLFVSHNLGSIRSLTTRTVVLAGGRMIFDGSTADGVACYVNENLPADARSATVATAKRTMPGLDQNLRIVELELMDFDDEGSLGGDGLFRLKLGVEAHRSCGDFLIAMTIYARDQTPIGNTFSEPLPAPAHGQTRQYRVSAVFPLAPGRYHCGISLVSARSGGREPHDSLADILPFRVFDGSIVDREPSRPWNAGWGYIRLDPLRAIGEA